MSSIGSIATSGLFASEKRARAAAENIVNARTVGFDAKDVQQSADADGSVTSKIVDRAPPTVKITNPDGTVEDLPNVSLDEEVVNLEIASYDYKANALVFKTDRELKETLIDIQA